MEAGGIMAALVFVGLVIAGLFIFFEVLGFTPGGTATGAGSAH